MTRDSLGEEARLAELEKLREGFDVAKFVQAMAAEDLAEEDPERLTRWLKAACIATSVEEIDWDLLTVPTEPG